MSKLMSADDVVGELHSGRPWASVVGGPDASP